jgi:hypothetical protein
MSSPRCRNRLNKNCADLDLSQAGCLWFHDKGKTECRKQKGDFMRLKESFHPYAGITILFWSLATCLPG